MGIQVGTVFSELANVEPIYCSGVAYVIVDHGNLHFALYQETILGDGTRDRVIVKRIVMPQGGYLAGAAMTEFEMQAARKSGLGPAELMLAAHA